MSITVLILTHEQIGITMLKAANRIIGSLPLNTLAMTVDFDRKPEEIIAEVEELTSHFQGNDGILILTDMYGATPSNIAQHFITRENTKIIAGLNLPMLIRTLNYAHLNLNEVYEKALCGGKEGILLCESNQET